MCIIISFVLLSCIVQSAPLASDDVEGELQIKEEDPRLKAGEEEGEEANDHDEITEDDKGIGEEGGHSKLRADGEDDDDSNDNEEARQWYPTKTEAEHFGDDQRITDEFKYPTWSGQHVESNYHEEGKRGHYGSRPSHRKVALGYGKYEHKPWHWGRREIKYKYGATGFARGNMYPPESNFQLSPEFQEEFISQFEQ
eukprot:Seg934.4 transcript_id=Seg934.4/GoldUCD/mRNA.D3Y31 product="hypothetical protein" protein_id=Seg934.4/GoldUCD/D3Y31